MKKRKAPGILAIALVVIAAVCIVMAGYFVVSQMANQYAKKYLIDMPILSVAPSSELHNIVDVDYLASLKINKFNPVEISLSEDFQLFKTVEGKNTVYFRRMNNDLITGFVRVSVNEPGYFWKSKKVNLFAKLMALGAKNNYDFLTGMIYATKENSRGPRGMVFLACKSMFLPRLGDDKNLKIYKYVSADRKGYVITNISGADSHVYCYLFSKDNTYFEFYCKTNDPALSLEQVSTMISTLKKY